jgi:hypothetical protein
MSKSRSQELISLGDRLFGKKKQLDSLFQEIAWQFCPDLADFVSPIVLGDDWAADRMDGFPEQVSRELSSQIGAMLRPQDRPWFRTITMDDRLDSDESNARALQYITSVIKQNLYNPASKFIRSTKELDRFYVNFGQGVMSIEESPKTRDHLFFRNHHLKNCSWLENELGDVDHLHRKDKMTARAMMRMFNQSKIHSSVKEAAEKEPGKEFPLRVVVLPAEEYDMVREYAKDEDRSDKKRKLPFVICYVDVENQTILKESGLPEFIYVVPRWMRFADSQYAFSPATMAGLADARMAQMLSQIILEAGEKAVDPPMIGKQEVVIGEPNIMAGGISWVDMEHDSSLKEALDILNINADLRVGFEMRRDIREMLTKAFYLDKLMLPDSKKGTTAYEISQRLEEHVRNLLPLFEPMQIEYNTRVLDLSFSLLRNMNKFDWNNIPQELSGSDITWSFESPIQQAQDRVMVEQFKASLEVVAMGKQSGASTMPLNIDKAMRDAVRGVGGPAVWRKTVEEQEAEQQQVAQQKMTEKAMMEAQQGAAIAGQVGDAANKLGFQPSADKMIAAQAKANGGAPQQAPSGAGQGAEMQAGEGGPQQDQSQALADIMGHGASSQQQVAPLQPQAASMDDLMNMQKRILAQLSSLDETLRRPKRITVKRNKDGKIESATASQEG